MCLALLIVTVIAPSREAAAKKKPKPAPTVQAEVDALIAGGVDQLNGPMATVETFNAHTGKFTCVGGTNSGGVCNGVLAQPSFAASVAPLPGGQFLVAGGNGVGILCLNSAEVFNPGSGAFNPISGMTDAHCFAHTTTVLGNGEVLITGGEDQTGNLVNTADLYNPATGAFGCAGLGGSDPTTGYCLSTLTDARFLDTATLLANGQVLIAGGNDSNGKTVNTAEVFDPNSGTFGCTSLGGANPKKGFCNNAMTDSRQNHTATLIANGPRKGDVLIAGGIDAAGNVLQTAELFIPASGTFVCSNGSPPGSSGCPLAMTQARYLHAAILLDPRYSKGRNSGRILITGGEDANGDVLATAELYDPIAKSFSPAGSMTTSRALHSATLIAGGNYKGWVLIAGGIDNLGNSLSSAEIFNPKTGTFTAVGSMNLARSSAGGAGQVP